MKCQKCEKPATFHITDLTGEGLLELHLCAECARTYLQPEGEPAAPKMGNVIEGQLKLEQTAEELKELDNKTCPVCGISFFEFRQVGRLGCPYDYQFFQKELEPLLLNVHGSTEHPGKHPRRPTLSPEHSTEIIGLRRKLREAVEREDYEQASKVRDQIKQHEEVTRRDS
ncbi:MAG: UvrB/UvrC motif-containing protein [Pirellulaceae bacterium]